MPVPKRKTSKKRRDQRCAGKHDHYRVPDVAVELVLCDHQIVELCRELGGDGHNVRFAKLGVYGINSVKVIRELDAWEPRDVSKAPLLDKCPAGPQNAAPKEAPMRVRANGIDRVTISGGPVANQDFGFYKAGGPTAVTPGIMTSSTASQRTARPRK